MEVIDPGHKYALLTLDGDLVQTLTFVKRCDLENPERFPGNTDSYPGTTLQSVIRALLDRVKYLDNQIGCDENKAIIEHLRQSLSLLEVRAAKRHALPNHALAVVGNLTYCEYAPMCPECGHTICEHVF